MKINVKSKGTQPTCQMPFVLSCEHCLLSPRTVAELFAYHGKSNMSQF